MTGLFGRFFYLRSTLHCSSIFLPMRSKGRKNSKSIYERDKMYAISVWLSGLDRETAENLANELHDLVFEKWAEYGPVVIVSEDTADKRADLEVNM